FSDDSTSSKNSSKTKSNASSYTGTKVVLILLGVVAVGLFSFFLFKLWQKKKRDEQYARLLKLFEEDDELEAEMASKGFVVWKTHLSGDQNQDLGIILW
ncbi:hypothetical protein QQP08_007596, partial [Theobroma cacao]